MTAVTADDVKKLQDEWAREPGLYLRYCAQHQFDLLAAASKAISPDRANEETMNHEYTIARTRAIHAVLDAAALIVAEYPEVVAVWAEPTTPTDWEARYEVNDGQSGYVARSFLDGVRAGKISGHKAQTNPGAIRFEAREVGNWPTMKAEMVVYLEGHAHVAAVFWNAMNRADHFPAAVTLDEAIKRAQDDTRTRKNFKRGLCLFREQLQDAAAQPEAKHDVELVWVLPTKPCDLPVGMQLQYHGGAVFRLAETGHWNRQRFAPEAAATSDGDPVYARQPLAVGFPKPQPGVFGQPVTCACCRKELESHKALSRIIGGVMVYTTCGEHRSDAEFLAGALGLRDVKPSSINDVVNTVERKAANAHAANNIALESEIAVKQTARDDERRSKVAVLGEMLRQKVGPRFPGEGASDRVFERQNPRFK